jgi:hypothetical protein
MLPVIGQFVLMIREVLHDQEWQPGRIYFAHPALNASDAQQFPLGKSVVYDHPFSGVSFPRAVANYPIELQRAS